MRKHWRGFTLIELLVVVAIVALLIAILLPSLARSRKQARSTLCLGNERAQLQGWRSYVEEFRRFPELEFISFNEPRSGWAIVAGSSSVELSVAGPYRTATCRVLMCPETTEPVVHNGRFGTAHRMRPIGLGLPSVAGPTNIQFDGYEFYASYGSTWEHWKLSDVSGVLIRGAENPLIADSVDTTAGVGEWAPAPHDLESPNDPGGTAFISPSPVCIDRHMMAINVAFMDGHAEHVKLPDLWTIRWTPDWTRRFPQKVPGP